MQWVAELPSEGPPPLARRVQTEPSTDENWVEYPIVYNQNNKANKNTYNTNNGTF